IKENQTTITEFILLGFEHPPELWIPLFLLFFFVYIMTLAGNMTIVALVVTDRSLQTSMYIFLGNLSFLEMCYTSTILPRMLANIFQDSSISYVGCATQMYFLLFLGSAECILLAVMAYDRYMAIFNPLQYLIHMNRRVCLSFSLLSVVGGNLVSLVQTIWVFTLPFCASNKIDYFFCDIPPLIKLSCINTSMFEIQLLSATVLVIVIPFILILVSYILIISSILAKTSDEGRWKTFSTCSSHIMVVILYYGTSSFIYIKPQYIFSEDKGKMLALIYTTITPMLNPAIYSIRNKEVQRALRKMMGNWKKNCMGTNVHMMA
uniref:Olfactory receptor n=1 Tax=Varanus komodoensis TaxID=61221 RepID=A0A8D2IUD6_VARKO